MKPIKPVIETVKPFEGSSVHTKILEQMSGSRSLAAALDSVDKAGVYTDALEQISGGGSLQSALDSFSKTRIYADALERVRGGFSLQVVLDSVNKARVYTDALEQISGGGSLQAALDSFSKTRIYADALERMKVPSFLQSTSVLPSFFDQLNDHEKFMQGYEEAFEELISSSQIKYTIENFIKSNSFRSDIDFFSTEEGIQSLVDASDFLVSEALIGDECEQSAEVKEVKKSSIAFLLLFFALMQLEYVAILFGKYLVIPVLINIAANVLTPSVEKVIQGNNSSKRELKKSIAAIRLEDVDLSQYRFVTADTLYLYRLPSTKSLVLDELKTGQVLTIVSKERNWIEVTYTYGNNQIYQGWVFTRHTEKFNLNN